MSNQKVEKYRSPLQGLMRPVRQLIRERMQGRNTLKDAEEDEKVRTRSNHVGCRYFMITSNDDIFLLDFQKGDNFTS